jgi:DNA (cytosine-5)-methyltransferase 1
LNRTLNQVALKHPKIPKHEDSETWIPGKVNPTLNSFDQGDVRATTAIVFENSYRDGARIAKDGVTQTLSAKMGTGGGNTPMLAVAYSIREDAKAGNFSATELDHANSLSALRPSTQSHHAQMFIAEPTMAVRRLTPLECERLMGWPDDHTRWKADGTEQADTHRYKQCGNGIASPVAQWIGKHLIKLGQQ